MQKGRVILPVSILVGILTGLAIMLVLPSTTPYSVVNTGSEGLSQIAEEFNARPVRLTAGLPGFSPGNTSLLVIHYGRLDPGGMRRLAAFADRGGLVIASGDALFLNQVLVNLNSSFQVIDSPIYDVIYSVNGNITRLLAFSPKCNVSVVAVEPRPLAGSGNASILIVTSNFSYVDINNNGYMDFEDRIGSQVVGVSFRYGNGRVAVVTSPEVFTNKLLDYNKKFIHCLIGGRTLLIDQSQPASNPFEYVKLVASYQPPKSVRYAALALASILGVVAYEVALRVE